MFIASKLWMPGPQDCIFQHLLEPEACDEGVRGHTLSTTATEGGGGVGELQSV